MQSNLLAAFTAVKDYLVSAVPELGKVVTHYEQPLDRNLTIILPDKTSGNDKKVFTLFVKIHTFEKNADIIAETQIKTAEKLYGALYPGADIAGSVMDAAVESIDFFDPTAQAPNIGVMLALVNVTIDFDDGCGG